MTIESLAADAEFIAQVGNDGASLAHRSLRKAYSCRRPLRLATAVATTGTGSPTSTGPACAGFARCPNGDTIAPLGA
jgi:hypothetical protein